MQTALGGVAEGLKLQVGGGAHLPQSQKSVMLCFSQLFFFQAAAQIAEGLGTEGGLWEMGKVAAAA